MEPDSEVWDQPTSFELEAPEVDCTLYELDQEDHSFFPSSCKAYPGFDDVYDILGLELGDLNEE